MAAERDRKPFEKRQKSPHFRIGAKQYGNVIRIRPGVKKRANPACDLRVLGIRIFAYRKCDRTNRPICRRKMLLVAVTVARDQRRGCLKDFLAAAVIHRKRDQLCVRVVFRKAQHNLRRRAAETVHGLVIITDREQVTGLARKHADHFVLHGIDILEFIHEDVGILALPDGENIGTFREQFTGQRKHVFKVHQIAVPCALRILPEHREEQLAAAGTRLVRGRVGRPRTFIARDFLTNCLKHLRFLRKLRLQFGKNVTKHLMGHGIPQYVRRAQVIFILQNVKEDGVKCAEGDAGILIPGIPEKPFPHLGCGGS